MFNDDDYSFDDDDSSLSWDLEPVDEPVSVGVAPLPVRIVDAVRTLVASCHGRPGSEASELVNMVRAADQVLTVLDVDARTTWEAIVEIVDWEARSLVSGVVDLTDLPSAAMYSHAVQSALAGCATLADQGGLPVNPAAHWLAVVEEVQRQRARSGAQRLIGAIDRGSSVTEVVSAYREIEPPTARKGEVRTRAVRTASEVAADAAAISASAPTRRFSSGYRTLDLWVTNPASGEPLGFIAPGEGVVIAAGTGQGKSSFSYGFVPAIAQDLRNWGLPDAKVYFAHTEEASADKVDFMRLGPGQRFHHLGDQVVVADVGSSREAFVMGLYDCVIDAAEQSRATGRPIVEFLPHVVVLDYIQSLSGEGEDNVVTSTYKTAELILRGIQAWNPDEMRKFSNVDFATYAGMPWPKGMEHHRVATVAFAQLVKAAGNVGPYRPGARGVQLSQYTVLDGNGDPVWEPKEGDQPVLGKGDIFGSSTILNNATFIVFLHRSNIFAGRHTAADGKMHLDDTRARLIIDKMRNGAVSNVVPMAYDSMSSGKRGQYYDPVAEQAIDEGRFAPDEAWKESGDPILPTRPAPRPLTGWVY